MTSLSKTLHYLMLLPAVALLPLSGCSDNGGNTDAAEESTTKATDTGTESADGNDSMMEAGDGDGDCAPMQAEAAGECDLVLGAAWDGEACHVLSGCECVGDDCADLFESAEACEAAYADCIGGGGCAGLGFEACAANPACQPINGSPLENLGDFGWCAHESVYLGCSSELGCGEAISFACPDQGDAIYQTVDTCLPDVDYSPCQPPDEESVYEPCP
ncbi:hypothetical protein [Enhygromyxa salina]|uniref:Uncharacterized protein n=1 Tax=Enhygromyxa salina TaxID=215803 RepID=A0A2S9YVR1_9BACT|nr:hypothetical protein [Enhygromyxa salina]PRQ09132.1 hypothetical protein ENSA7_11220 [Enhygromyxa salina]